MELLQEIPTLHIGVTRGEWLGLDSLRRPLVRWPGGPRDPVVAQVSSAAIPPGTAEDSGAIPALILPPVKAGERPVLLALLLDAIPQSSVPDRAVIEAKEQVVVRCGNARLELDGDGAVRLRGRTILSRCSSTHRIKGGTVQIN
jgi:hypothetical protein